MILDAQTKILLQQELINKRIDNVDTQTIFLNEFKLEDVEFDVTIHKTVEGLRQKTESDWTLLWGFHNGRTTGPVHMRRLSIIDESFKQSNASFFTAMQNINVNLWSRYILEMWGEDAKTAPFVTTRTTAEDLNLREWMRENDIDTIVSAPVYIEQYSHPIAFVGVYYKNFDNRQENVTLVKSEISNTAAQLSYQFSKKHISNQ